MLPSSFVSMKRRDRATMSAARIAEDAGRGHGWAGSWGKNLRLRLTIENGLTHRDAPGGTPYVNIPEDVSTGATNGSGGGPALGTNRGSVQGRGVVKILKQCVPSSAPGLRLMGTLGPWKIWAGLGRLADRCRRSRSRERHGARALQAQIASAKAKIGEEQRAIQEYCDHPRGVEAEQVVGIEQSESRQKAEIKVISNTVILSKASASVMELFSANGGTKSGTCLKVLAPNRARRAIIGKVCVYGEQINWAGPHQ